MDIKKLLKRSKIKWPGNEEDLVKDFENIIHLIESLPEPKSEEIHYKRFATLFEDEEGKEAKKRDIIDGDFFII